MNQTRRPFVPGKIVSGGQTGIDRAALDVAIELGIPHGGWCPRGRLAEDGTISDQYQLTEHRSAQYKARTLQNVLDSDATLILYRGKLSGGTRLTQRYAIEADRALMVIAIDEACRAGAFWDWLDDCQPNTLNIAGPRESNHPGIYKSGSDSLRKLLDRKQAETLFD